jgi:hypothetical protein
MEILNEEIKKSAGLGVEKYRLTNCPPSKVESLKQKKD